MLLAALCSSTGHLKRRNISTSGRHSLIGWAGWRMWHSTASIRPSGGALSGWSTNVAATAEAPREEDHHHLRDFLRLFGVAAALHQRQSISQAHRRQRQW